MLVDFLRFLCNSLKPAWSKGQRLWRQGPNKSDPPQKNFILLLYVASVRHNDTLVSEQLMIQNTSTDYRKEYNINIIQTTIHQSKTFVNSGTFADINYTHTLHTHDPAVANLRLNFAAPSTPLWFPQCVFRLALTSCHGDNGP